MQGHAAIAVCRAGKEQGNLRTNSSWLYIRPLASAKTTLGMYGVKAVFEQSLVGSRIVRLDEDLMGLFQLPVLTQGKLVVV